MAVFDIEGGTNKLANWMCYNGTMNSHFLSGVFKECIAIVGGCVWLVALHVPLVNLSDRFEAPLGTSSLLKTLHKNCLRDFHIWKLL